MRRIWRGKGGCPITQAFVDSRLRRNPVVGSRLPPGTWEGTFSPAPGLVECILNAPGNASLCVPYGIYFWISCISSNWFLSLEYNLDMPGFRFYHPIEIRYGDLDPQGHVNNARYLTFIEQARISYIRHLGLWDGSSFLDIGIILASVQMTFLAPILWGQPVRVGVHTSRLGNKSLDMAYTITDQKNEIEYANGSCVLVAYDYASSSTIPIPDHWRQTILDYENLDSAD